MTRRSRAKVRIVYHVTITEVTTTSRTGEPDVVDALELPRLSPSATQS